MQWQEENRDEEHASNCSSRVSVMAPSSDEPRRHVDYHKCCTPLYKKIEQKDWDDVEFFLENHRCTCVQKEFLSM
jgi:hypothetical protein